MQENHQQFVKKIIQHHFEALPNTITRMTTGICNEVYMASIKAEEVIVRLSPVDKFLMGSHINIPKFKKFGIKVPDILAEDYSKTLIPYSYQIQSKIEGQDLGEVIATLTDAQLQALAKAVAKIFKKVQTIPSSEKFGIVWGGENEFSDSWTERMKIWIKESEERGRKTGIMDDALLQLAESLYGKSKDYFDSVIPVTYYGDICSKNIMIHHGAFNGLVDLDGLTQGDPLEAVGRIKTSWYGTHYGEYYTNAVMDELGLNESQRKMVKIYALLNQISWACENGIQFNQNTKPLVDSKKDKRAKKIIWALNEELTS